jgi:hypothetical protein
LLLVGAQIALAAVGVLTVRQASAGGPRVGAAYVALGDSYAAGEGLGGFDGGFEAGTAIDPSPADGNRKVLKNTCHRSLKDAYGSIQPAIPVVLPSLKGKRANWACSGARTTDMVIAQGDLPISNAYYQHGQPAQTSTVNGTTEWISISAGGNDLEFSKIGKACVVYTFGATTERVHFGDVFPCARQVALEKAKLPTLKKNLKTLYRDLLDNAGKAVLAVVGYPRIFPRDYSDAYTTDSSTSAQGCQSEMQRPSTPTFCRDSTQLRIVSSLNSPKSPGMKTELSLLTRTVVPTTSPSPATEALPTQPLTDSSCPLAGMA